MQDAQSSTRVYSNPLDQVTQRIKIPQPPPISTDKPIRFTSWFRDKWDSTSTNTDDANSRSASPSQSGWLGITLGIWLVQLMLAPGVAWGADRIILSYGLLQRSISINSLRTYANEGVISSDLRYYTQFLDLSQREQLRQALLAQANLGPVAVAQFLYTAQGEILLRRLGEVIRTESNLSGFYAIRSALILAAADPEGLTVLNVLDKFPLSGIQIDLGRTLQILGDLERLIRQTQSAIALIEQQSTVEAAANSSVNFSALPNLERLGAFTWQKYSIRLHDSSRDRSFPADIYLPERPNQAPLMNAPVIVISHGLGSDRSSYAYLAEQLASYGFAVALPEHPGSNAQQLQALISGRASEVTAPAEFVNRPLDIKFLLDQLTTLSQTDARFQGRLNLQQVGVVGQSFGGYTALALAGAKINVQQLTTDCRTDTLNLSLLLQCRALQLPQPIPSLADERVKAVIAINPIGSSLIGETDFGAIHVPVLFVSGSADTIAPALLEQIRPFTWLQTSSKYFLLLVGGTHFSTIDAPESDRQDLVHLPPEVVGPDPRLARTYMKALSVAFFSTYIADNPDYSVYLDAAYVKYLSRDQLPVNLVQSLTSDQVSQLLQTRPTESASSKNSASSGL
jgi:predicted dienelactone hydrolase